MGNSKKDSKTKSYEALEKDKKKTGKELDLPKSPNRGEIKKK